MCGGISRFAVGMSLAHGVPALMVGQPGHCAYIWYKNKKWVLGNNISGWAKSRTHSHIQYTWKRPAPFFPVMERAPMNLNDYRLSEKLRVAAKFARGKNQLGLFEAASVTCPHNYAVWMDLEIAIEQPSLSRNEVHFAMLNTLKTYRENMAKVNKIALKKAGSTDCNPDKAYNILIHDSCWVYTQELGSSNI